MNGADLSYYGYVLVRRLPLMIVTGAIVAAAGLSYVMSLPPVYRASGTILVELPQIPAKLAPVPDSVGALTRLQVIQQQLLTHNALLDLAKRQSIFPANEMPTPATVVQNLRERIALEPMTFGGSQDALGFTVSFTADEPQLAARVANDLISTILQRDLDSRSESADATLSFFNDEVDRLAKKVDEVENHLKEFKTANVDALPDTMSFRRTLQINLRDRLLVLESEQSSLQSRRAGYVEFYRKTGAVSDAPIQTPEQAQLVELNRILASQRMLFADDSPTIIAVKQQIAAVQAILKAGINTPPTADNTSPLDLQLADIDDRLRAIAVERASLEHNDTQLTASIAATPGVEAALNGLQREHDNAQTLYNAAVARRAEALASQQVESRLKGDRLTLMESALPPEKPVGPKRLQFALGVLAAAAFAAIGLALGLEFLKPGVRRAAEIEQKLGIGVLAVIPILPHRAPSRFSLMRLAGGRRPAMEVLRQ